jgi:hypothetical protein
MRLFCENPIGFSLCQTGSGVTPPDPGPSDRSGFARLCTFRRSLLSPKSGRSSSPSGGWISPPSRLSTSIAFQAIFVGRGPFRLVGIPVEGSSNVEISEAEVTASLPRAKSLRRNAYFPIGAVHPRSPLEQEGSGTSRMLFPYDDSRPPRTRPRQFRDNQSNCE